MRVLAFAPYPSSAPSTRYRIVELREALRRLGVSLELHTFADEPAYRVMRQSASPPRRISAWVDAVESLRGALDRSSGFDAVLIQRGIGPLVDRWVLPSLLRRATPIVYDFDDAVFMAQEGGRPWLESLRRPRETTRALCRAASVVLAGNEYLADFAREALGPARADAVRLLPSVVDTARYRPVDTTERSRPTLGWIGSDSTIPYLEDLAPSLRALAADTPHRLVVVAGDRRPELGGVDFEFVAWQDGEDVALFQGLDVGLYPLRDSPWSRGKCGFKAIQYLACGVPCVASPVGVLRHIVRPMETGLHATTAEEWVEACRQLLRDRALRTRLGGNGRRMVEVDYSVDVAAPVLANALRDVAA